MSPEDLQSHLAQQLIIPDTSLNRVWLDEEGLALWLLKITDNNKEIPAELVTEFWSKLPYWAFAWAGGRAVARYISQDYQRVEDKTVLDFGCGSGIGAIAALQAGAKRVFVLDNDNNALMASQLNAALNGFQVEIFEEEHWADVDVLIASDVLYDVASNQDLFRLMTLVPNWIVAESDKVATKLENIRCVDQFTVNTLPEIGDFDRDVEINIYVRGGKQDLPVLN